MQSREASEDDEPDAPHSVPELEVEAEFIPELTDLQMSLEFINALKAATLDNGGLDEDTLQ